MIGIYKITNKLTGKCYIGQSIDIKKRLYYHFKQKFNLIEYTSEVILQCNKYDLDSYENYFIDFYNCMWPFGYNLESGGKSNYIISDITRERFRITSHIKIFSRKKKDETYFKIIDCINNWNWKDFKKINQSNLSRNSEVSRKTISKRWNEFKDDVESLNGLNK